jgi:hypothetical protein
VLLTPVNDAAGAAGLVLHEFIDRSVNIEIDRPNDVVRSWSAFVDRRGSRPGGSAGCVGRPGDPGNPQSPLRWTTKSTTNLASALTAQRHEASARTVAKLLKDAGYSTQANAKTIEANPLPDRNAQINYLDTTVQRFQSDGDPVISIDTNKKELVGNYRGC